MATQDLNCCVLIDNRFIVNQEFDDILHFSLSLLEEAVFLPLRQLIILVFEIGILSKFINLIMIINLIQLQFQKPGGQTNQLWSLWLEVLSVSQVINNLLQVVMQTIKQV